MIEMGQNRLVREGWVFCPICRKGKVLRLRPETRVVGLEGYCKRCNQLSVLDIDEAELRSRPV